MSAREIKFRAQEQLSYLSKDTRWKWTFWRVTSSYCPAPIIPGSVGQFTGMRDCNGKEIYEGDIIDLDDGVFAVIGWHPDGCWGYWSPINPWLWVGPSPNDPDENLRIWMAESRVVGNIHEHPELLEVQP